MTKEQYEKLKEYIKQIANNSYSSDYSSEAKRDMVEKELDKLMGFEE